MGDELDRKEVTAYLEAAGLYVSSIEEDLLDERCDLSATDAGEKYLIEVKAINDEDALVPTLRRGGVFDADRSPVFRKRVVKEFRKARNQLQSTAPAFENRVWLVAMISRSKCDVSFMTEQIRSTLYGVGAITETSVAGDSRRSRYLYFCESLFHRFPEVDGALVVAPDGAALHINDFGHRIERVQRSRLARFFAQHSACFDKQTMEQNADCLVADFEMDRRDTQAMFNRLEKEYPGRRLQYTDWHHTEFMWSLFGPSS